MNINIKKNGGFTLIELMIASTIATIVMVISFALISNVYLSRKQIRIAQNFYSESRFLLEKIVSISRENTIDYDRYFEEIGPDNTTCTSFHSDQGGSYIGPKQNTPTNRKSIGYSNIFYWEISNDVYRNLGGANINGSSDPCSQSFHGNLPELYLINKDLNVRTAIRLDDSDPLTINDEQIQTSIQIGIDSDGDGYADEWSEYARWESNGMGSYICYAYPNSSFINGDREISMVQDQDICNQIHDFEEISAKKLLIRSFIFTPYPDRDPFLNFRNDGAQIHPNIFLYLKVDLNNFDSIGFESQPTITMQTNVSSRVFGNIRE